MTEWDSACSLLRWLYGPQRKFRPEEQGCVCSEMRPHTCWRLASEVNWSIWVCTCFDTCSHTDLFNSSWTRFSCVGIQITIISLSRLSYFYIKLWGEAASCINQKRPSGVGSRVGTTCPCPFPLRWCPRKSHLNTFCVAQKDPTLLEMDVWERDWWKESFWASGLLRCPVRRQLATGGEGSPLWSKVHVKWNF